MSRPPAGNAASGPTTPLEAVRLRGLLLAVAGACLFSTKPIFIKFAYAYPVDPATLMTLRMGFALPFYVFFALMAVRERKSSGKPFDLSGHALLKTASIGVLGYYVASYLDLVGLTMITAQFERLILFTYPTFVVLLGALLFGQAIGLRLAVAMAVTYAGLALIFGQDLQLFGKEVILGSACTLGAAFTFAGFVLFSQFQIRKLGSRMFTCLAMIAASFAIILHFLFTHPLESILLPSPVYGWALMIAILSTVVPSFLIAAAIERIGPGRTATLSGIGPVFTTVLGVSLLGEPFTFWHFAGMLLVISGALILARDRTKPEER